MQDNYILKDAPAESDSIECVKEYTNKGKLHPDFEPVLTYDMVQAGYPTPNHGAMVARYFGRTDAGGRMLPGGGMWCKYSDVKEYLSGLKIPELGKYKPFIVANIREILDQYKPDDENGISFTKMVELFNQVAAEYYKPATGTVTYVEMPVTKDSPNYDIPVFVNMEWESGKKVGAYLKRVKEDDVEWRCFDDNSEISYGLTVVSWLEPRALTANIVPTAEEIGTAIHRHLGSLKYEGGYPPDYLDTLSEHLHKFIAGKIKQPVNGEEDNLLSWVAIFHGALHELVQLKQYKEENGKDQYYEEAKEKAWYEANFALDLWKKSNYGAMTLNKTNSVWIDAKIADLNHVVINACMNLYIKTSPDDHSEIDKIIEFVKSFTHATQCLDYVVLHENKIQKDPPAVNEAKEFAWFITRERYNYDFAKEKYIAAWDNYKEYTVTELYDGPFTEFLNQKNKAK